MWGDLGAGAIDMQLEMMRHEQRMREQREIDEEKEKVINELKWMARLAEGQDLSTHSIEAYRQKFYRDFRFVDSFELISEWEYDILRVTFRDNRRYEVRFTSPTKRLLISGIDSEGRAVMPEEPKKNNLHKLFTVRRYKK